jgi:hypothetical protein
MSPGSRVSFGELLGLEDLPSSPRQADVLARMDPLLAADLVLPFQPND